MELQRWPGPSIALALSFLTPCFALQASMPDDVFTIEVAAPTSAKEVQVRYFFTGEFGGDNMSAVASPVDGSKIVIKTGIEGKAARTFKAIVYAPGCQFVTISVADLLAGNRQGEFQCVKLPTVQLRGRANVGALSGRELQVEVLYVVGWAGKFFEITDVALSPITLGKADVQSDGSFAIQVPDFSRDPLWQSLSKDATLAFFLKDARSGKPLSPLHAPDELSNGGHLRVAPTYPEIEFTIQP